MKSIFSNPQHRARLGKHGHDLSRRVMFTSSVGHLLPVLYDYLNPGDSVNINSSLFTRTQPLLTPAFVRCSEHIDYFFVPMKLVDGYFGNAFYGISDFSNVNDSVDSGKGDYFKAPMDMPMLDLKDVKGAIINGLYQNTSSTPKIVDGLYANNRDAYGIPLVSNFIRLSSMLGYSENLCSTTKIETTDGSSKVNVYPFAVYQRIFSDYYRNSEYTSNYVSSYSMNGFYFNPLRLGYQLQTYFGDKDAREADYVNTLFCLRYHGTKRDYFTSVKRTPLFGSYGQVNSYAGQTLLSSTDLDSSMLLSSYGINGEADYQQAVPNGGVANAGIPLNANITVNTPSQASGSSGFNLSALRTAYAMDKLARITAKAGKHYDAQTLAHFGVKVPKGVSDEVYHIGSHSQALQIGEVISTAETNVPLGTLAGRGASKGRSKAIKFTAPCHGFLMAIYSAVPDIDYAAFGLNRVNQYASINDFYHPEFDRLGMSPVYYGNYLFSLNNTRSSTFMGWNYRYLELKTNYDIVHGAFNYTLRDWASTHNNTYASIVNPTQTSVSDFYQYVSPCYLDNIFTLSFAPPSVTDTMFDNLNVSLVMTYEIGTVNVPALTSVSPVFERDPLLHSIDFKYYKTSVMSPYGEPSV